MEVVGVEEEEEDEKDDFGFDELSGNTDDEFSTGDGFSEVTE